MNKRLIALLMMALLIMSVSLCACGAKEEAPAEEPQQEEETTSEGEGEEFPGAAYGYAGNDPLELEAYRYFVETVSKNFDKADVSIPTVNIFNVDYTDPDDVLVRGDFSIDNYNIEGDTLKAVSGGNFPGVIHMKQDGDKYTATGMDFTEDGSDFDESAKKLFGDYYEDFIKIHSDDDARNELRKVTVSDYVNMNGLDKIIQFQDEGWDPVELYKN